MITQKDIHNGIVENTSDFEKICLSHNSLVKQDKNEQKFS